MTRTTRLVAISLVAIGAVAARPADEVKLDKLKIDAFHARIKANTSAKYTLVDAWATWCAPCKANFSHVVEMHKKYGPKGLAVISLSLDDPDNPKALAEALRFLKEKEAVFTNIVNPCGGINVGNQMV